MSDRSLPAASAPASGGEVAPVPDALPAAPAAAAAAAAAAASEAPRSSHHIKVRDPLPFCSPPVF